MLTTILLIILILILIGASLAGRIAAVGVTFLLDLSG